MGVVAEAYPVGLRVGGIGLRAYGIVRLRTQDLGFRFRVEERDLKP